MSLGGRIRRIGWGQEQPLSASVNSVTRTQGGDLLPCGKLRPLPAVTRILSIPLRGTGGVLAPIASGCRLPGVGVVDLDPSCEGTFE